MSEPDSKNEKIKAGVLRRLAASFYDGLLLLAALMIASALTVPLTQSGVISPGSIFIKLYMLTVCYIFFTWFWVHGGRTLGMKVWHIRIEQMSGETVTWKQASIRFISGLPTWVILLSGFIRAYVPEAHQKDNFPAWLMAIDPWLLIVPGLVMLVADHWKISWRDKVSNTQIIFKK